MITPIDTDQDGERARKQAEMRRQAELAELRPRLEEAMELLPESEAARQIIHAASRAGDPADLRAQLARYEPTLGYYRTERAARIATSGAYQRVMELLRNGLPAGLAARLTAAEEANEVAQTGLTQARQALEQHKGQPPETPGAIETWKRTLADLRDDCEAREALAQRAGGRLQEVRGSIQAAFTAACRQLLDERTSQLYTERQAIETRKQRRREELIAADRADDMRYEALAKDLQIAALLSVAPGLGIDVRPYIYR